MSAIGEMLDNDPTGKDLQSFMEIGRKTTWISCIGDKASGETMIDWSNTHKKHLQQWVKMITHKSVVES